MNVKLYAKFLRDHAIFPQFISKTQMDTLFEALSMDSKADGKVLDLHMFVQSLGVIA